MLSFMPERTACRRCARVGYVRMETVLTGGTSVQTFFCGLCDGSWDIDGDGVLRDKPHADDDRPDESRILR